MIRHDGGFAKPQPYVVIEIPAGTSVAGCPMSHGAVATTTGT